MILQCFIFSIILVNVTFLLYLRKRKRKAYQLNEDVIIFTDRSEQCETHLLTNEACRHPLCPVTQLNRLLRYLASARTSLYICTYSIQYDPLKEVVIEAYRSGIDVKIITQHRAPVSGFDVFLKRGIQVCFMKCVDRGLMHNKFVIIDQELLITGSANWTRCSILSNYETVVITNSTNMVNKYNNYFTDMWNNYF